MGAPQSKGLRVAAVPNIREVRPEAARSVIVTWRGGAESIVDLAPLLNDYTIFEPLRQDERRFREVEIGEWGWCLRWSDDMEIASDTVWRLALEQGAGWLRGWRAAHRLTQTEAARALGVSPRMWRYYEAGSHLLPKTVRLAGIGLDALTRAA
jgi:uncharacterized protein DUF2442/helix-turn-helix protein